MNTVKTSRKSRPRGIATAAVCLLLAGCSSFAPKMELAATAPYQEVTQFSEALYRLGQMTVIYNTPTIGFQSGNVGDNTGASHPLATGGEIQANITEIVKSTLNSIGGQVTFIEYDPAYINNQIATGYSKFENRAIPDVVVTGGITAFDRAMETISDGVDASVDLQFNNIQNGEKPVWPPSTLLGMSYSDATKASVARISLDFNLKSFTTLAGIPFMTATNSMLVRKGLHDRDLSVTVFGPSLGLKGNTTKVQGRHQAVRLLVQSSMVHLVGRYLAVPYWRLLGKDAQPDRFVMLQLRNSYYRMNEFDRLVKAQIWLLIHGNSVDVNGQMDAKTIAALKEFDPAFDAAKPALTDKLYEAIYLGLPLDEDALQRRLTINRMLAS